MSKGAGVLLVAGTTRSASKPSLDRGVAVACDADLDESAGVEALVRSGQELHAALDEICDRVVLADAAG
jgi:hypothetical protein